LFYRKLIQFVRFCCRVPHSYDAILFDGDVLWTHQYVCNLQQASPKGTELETMHAFASKSIFLSSSSKTDLELHTAGHEHEPPANSNPTNPSINFSLILTPTLTP
jgi:hypothetical protein